MLVNNSYSAVNAADLAERRSEGAGPLQPDEYKAVAPHRMLKWPQAQLPGRTPWGRCDAPSDAHPPWWPRAVIMWAISGWARIAAVMLGCPCIFPAMDA